VDGSLKGAAYVLENLFLRTAQLRPLLEGHAERLVQRVALLIGYQVRAVDGIAGVLWRAPWMGVVRWQWWVEVGGWQWRLHP